MNDNAHFYFFILGFLGFTIFFFSTIVFFDVITALLNGSIGCLGFAILGRQFLALILTSHRNLLIQGKDVLSKDQTNVTENSEVVKNFTPKQS